MRKFFSGKKKENTDDNSSNNNEQEKDTKKGLTLSRVARKKKVKANKRLSLNVRSGSVSGVVTSFKGGQLSIETVFTKGVPLSSPLNERGTVSAAVPVVAPRGKEVDAVVESIPSITLEEIKDIHKEYKIPRKGLSVLFEEVVSRSRIEKYPPIEGKLIDELIEDSYTNFIDTETSKKLIRGFEYLGSRGYEQGEKYYLLSAVGHRDINSILLQMERSKLRVSSVYNDVLALRNVLTSVNSADNVKCLINVNKKTIQIIVMYGETLIFHKRLESSSVSENLAPPRVYVPPAEPHEISHMVAGLLPDIVRSLEYVQQKEEVSLPYILISGEGVGDENVLSVLQEGTGIACLSLNIKEQTDRFGLISWYDTENYWLERDFVIPYGLALKGVVGV